MQPETLESPKRVLFISPQPFFIERGSPYRVRSTVQGLIEQGFVVDILCYPFGSDLNMTGLTIERSYCPLRIKRVPIGISWTKVFLDLFLFLKALKLILSRSYVIVHGVEEAGVMALICAKLRKIPYIFDMHSHMSEQLSQCVIRPGGFCFRLLHTIEKFCMRRAGGIITVSDVISDRVTKIAPGVPVMTLEDLPLGVDQTVESSQEMALRERYGLQNCRVVVYTGNFEPYQGIDLLLESFEVCFRRSECTDVRLVIVGGGSDSEQRLRTYRERIQLNGLGSYIIFAGQQPESEMAVFMAVADVLVSPRIAGAHTPLKIYSYMAAGRTIVATRIAAHTNVLDDEHAYLAEPVADRLAESLLLAMDSSAEAQNTRERMVQNSKALLERRFSVAEFRRRLGLLYRAALQESVPTADSADLSAHRSSAVAANARMHE